MRSPSAGRRWGFGWPWARRVSPSSGLVVGGGAFPLFIGILVGLGGAIGLARFIQSMLFATDPIDPLTLAGVSVLFAAVALTACLVPAAERRASILWRPLDKNNANASGIVRVHVGCGRR